MLHVSLPALYIPAAETPATNQTHTIPEAHKIKPFHLKILRLGCSPAAWRGADTGLAGCIPPWGAAASLGIAGGHGMGQFTGLQVKPLWELFLYVAIWICRFNYLKLAN